MASTYSNLKIQLMTTGENATTWGSVTNTNLGTALEEAIVGSADVTFSNANTSISLSNSNASQAARNMRLNLTGSTGGSTRTLTVPDTEKVYIVNNTCADAIEIKNSTGSNVSVPAGKTTWVYSTGSNVVAVTTHLTSLTLGTDLAVTEGGTGASTLNAEAVVIGNGTSAVKFVAPGTSGNVLTSNGTAWTSGALETFSSGMILLWSGSTGSIPPGWVLCDGTNSTPDLRNRFIVGAGSTYAVDATGGSADATLPSHTHTATSTVTDPGHSHIQFATGPKNNSFDSGTFVANDQSGSTSTNTTGITVSTSLSTEGSSATNANLPPYYALAYIMKT
jgi:hypothetical protein